MTVSNFRFIKASFRKPHNWSKIKIFLVLWRRKYKEGNDTGMDYLELHKATGLTTASLASRLGVLSGMTGYDPYINAKPVFGENRHLIKKYTIADRGVRFLFERTPKDVLEQVIKELQDWKEQNG